MEQKEITVTASYEYTYQLEPYHPLKVGATISSTLQRELTDTPMTIDKAIQGLFDGLYEECQHQVTEQINQAIGNGLESRNTERATEVLPA